MKFKYQISLMELIIYLVIIGIEITGIMMFLTNFWFYSLIFGALLIITALKITSLFLKSYKITDNELIIKNIFTLKIGYAKISNAYIDKTAVIVTHILGKRNHDVYLFPTDLNGFYDKLTAARRIFNDKNPS